MEYAGEKKRRTAKEIPDTISYDDGPDDESMTAMGGGG